MSVLIESLIKQHEDKISSKTKEQLFKLKKTVRLSWWNGVCANTIHTKKTVDKFKLIIVKNGPEKEPPKSCDSSK